VVTQGNAPTDDPHKHFSLNICKLKSLYIINMADVMPPMGQGEDPNDPNKQISEDERKKLELIATLPRDIQAYIIRFTQGYLENEDDRETLKQMLRTYDFPIPIESIYDLESYADRLEQGSGLNIAGVFRDQAAELKQDVNAYREYLLQELAESQNVFYQFQLLMSRLRKR